MYNLQVGVSWEASENVDGAVKSVKSGFIPGRHISGDIVFAHELDMDHYRKIMFLRCILNVDLKKVCLLQMEFSRLL